MFYYRSQRNENWKDLGSSPSPSNKKDEYLKGKKLYCHICNYRTGHYGNLKRHVLIHKASIDVEYFSCDICDYKTRYRGYLKNHLLTHKDIEEVEHFSCEFCDFKTKRRRNIQSHVLIHKDINEDIHYSCDICDYKTKFRDRLKKHALSHKDFKQFSCNNCNYKTNVKIHLKYHALVHKSNENEIDWSQCPHCNNRYKCVYYLRRHIKRMHEQGETYICHDCGYKTHDKCNLRSHCIKHKKKLKM